MKDKGVGIFSISYYFHFFIIKVFKCFGAHKGDLDPLNVTLLHLYFQNYIIMEEMERIENGEDPNSK
jgi:hypothetical protein